MKKENGIHHCVIVHIDLECPDLTALPNLQISSSLRHMDVEVELTCASNMKMTDGYSSKTVTCESNGQWSSHVSGCDSKTLN